MMGADKEFVLAHWGEGLDEDYTDDHQFFFIADSGVNFDSWSSAAEFTRARLEEIRQVEEEIATQSEFCQHGDECGLCAVVARTVARLQAALAELKRGMTAGG